MTDTTREDTTGTPKGLRVITGGKEGESPAGHRLRSAKTASGLTEKQEAFARALAEGATNADAYRKAFGAEGYAPRTLHSKACALAARDDIKVRVNAFVGEKRAKAQLVSERVSDRVWRNVWAIIEDPETPPAAKVSALQLAAKAGGMLVDRVETRSLNTPEDIERELKERLAKFTGTSG